MKNLLNSKLLYQLAAFIISFAVYILTLAPTVSYIDSGELAAASINLGIAHPTGYPLFTILGRIFSLLPFFGSEIYKLNLMAAFFCSAALVTFFNIMSLLLKDNSFISNYREDNSRTGSKSFKLSNQVIYAVSLSATLLLAFSKTYWATANSIEVYSLHIFFLTLNIYLFLKASDYSLRADADSTKTERYWVLFAFVLGLSFTNHLSTVFLSVGFLYLYFSINGFNRFAFKRIFFLILPFLAGYSVYIYFFIRADNPVLSWGNPHNFENFWRHFTGKQFSLWMFSSFGNAFKQFSHFTETFPKEYFYLPIILAIPGLVEIFRKSRRLFYFTVLLFIFCIIYAINYDIYDIDSYFLLAFIVSAIWIGFGLLFFIKKLSAGSDGKRNSTIIAYGTLLLFLLPLSSNYSKVDESENYFVKDYVMNMLNSAPENAIVFSVQWDFWVSASLYYQSVEKIRPDVAIIDKELMIKSWYMKYIQDHYPDIYENSKLEFQAYLTELLKFEKNTIPYTAPVTEADRQNLIKIQNSFINLLTSIVDKNYGRRPFCVTFEIEQDPKERFAQEYTRIPRGLLIEFTKEKNLKYYPFPDMKFNITQSTDYHPNFIMNSYYGAYIANANYLMNLGKFEEAENLIRKAIEIRPNAPEAPRLLTKLNQLKAIPHN